MEQSAPCLTPPPSPTGYWRLKEDNEYKNKIIISLQRKLTARGIPRHHLRCFVQQLYQENGQLNPLIIGDYGYAYGLGQWYDKRVAARIRLNREAVKKPDGSIDLEKEIERQLERLADDMAHDYKARDGDIKKAVASHNGPGRIDRGEPDSCRNLKRVNSKGVAYYVWSCYFRDEVNRPEVSNLFIFSPTIL